ARPPPENVSLKEENLHFSLTKHGTETALTGANKLQACELHAKLQEEALAIAPASTRESLDPTKEGLG
ncbi:hypothetical protein C0993_006979, partial [Termitomyces sp. T159_Od127]